MLLFLIGLIGMISVLAFFIFLILGIVAKLKNGDVNGNFKKMGFCIVIFIVTGFLIAHIPYSSGDNISNDSVAQDINENKYGVTYKNDEVAFNNWLDQSIRNTIDNLNSIDDGKITAIERVDIDKKVELLLQFQEITDKEVYEYARKRTGEIVTIINQNL